MHLYKESSSWHGATISLGRSCKWHNLCNVDGASFWDTVERKQRSWFIAEYLLTQKGAWLIEHLSTGGLVEW